MSESQISTTKEYIIDKQSVMLTQEAYDRLGEAEGYGGGMWAYGFWRPARKIRHLLREPLAECIGTACITFFGPGSGCLTTYTGAGSGDWVVITWSWGMAVMLGAYASAGASGGHLNPAVTISLAVFEGFSWLKVPIYIIAQIIGGWLGCTLGLLLFEATIKDYNLQNGGAGECVVNTAHTYDPALGADGSGTFVTWPHATISNGRAFAIEMVLTAWLMFGILAVTCNRSSATKDNGLGPFLVSIVVILIGMSWGALTGYAINPARDFGCRLGLVTVCFDRSVFTADNYYFIVPLIAPIVGGLLGSSVFYMMIDNKLPEDELED